MGLANFGWPFFVKTFVNPAFAESITLKAPSKQRLINLAFQFSTTWVTVWVTFAK
jgi:hypothetical protein